MSHDSPTCGTRPGLQTLVQRWLARWTVDALAVLVGTNASSSGTESELGDAPATPAAVNTHRNNSSHSFTPFAVPPGRFTSTFIRTPRYIFLKRRAAEQLALLATSTREIMHLAVHARHAYDARLNLTTRSFARFSALSLSSPIRFFPFLLFAGTEGAQWW